MSTPTTPPKPRKPVSPQESGRRGGLKAAANAYATGTATARTLPARLARWRKLGADISDAGDLLNTPATRQARRLLHLQLKGVAGLPLPLPEGDA